MQRVNTSATNPRQADECDKVEEILVPEEAVGFVASGGRELRLSFSFKCRETLSDPVSNQMEEDGRPAQVSLRLWQRRRSKADK